MLPEGLPAPSTDERGTVEAGGRTEDIDDAVPKLRRALPQLRVHAKDRIRSYRRGCARTLAVIA